MTTPVIEHPDGTLSLDVGDTHRIVAKPPPGVDGKLMLAQEVYKRIISGDWSSTSQPSSKQ